MDLTTQSVTVEESKCADMADMHYKVDDTSDQGHTPPPTKYPANETGAVLLKEEYDTFQSWATRNYGETSKTKTVTVRKYNRIKRTLTGDELPSSENAKFRFWVKAKGFKLGPSSWRTEDSDTRQVLYVPTKVQTPHGTMKEFKRVAIVDDFYDIIYSMHVDPDTRGGKHAGQKRTYRAIAETYAFLPREAVTRFLMSCSDCQKRMHLSPEHLINHEKSAVSPLSSRSLSGDIPQEEDSNSVGDADLEASLLNFNVPITTTYLNHIKKKKMNQADVEEATMEESSNNHMDKLINLSPRQEGHNNDSQLSSPEHAKRSNRDKLSETEGVNSPLPKHGKCTNKMKSHYGKASSKRHGRVAQTKTLPSEASVSPRTANLYKPYESTSHHALDISKPRHNTSTLSPQPASTAGSTSAQEMRQPIHLEPGCYTGSTGEISHHLTRKSYPNNLLYVHTEGERLPTLGYHNPVSCEQSTRVKPEENEPTNLSMKKADRAATAYSYMNRYLSGTGKTPAFPDQDPMMKLLTIKQLILGYRESAAFLYRSAQELEQLLLKYS